MIMTKVKLLFVASIFLGMNALGQTASAIVLSNNSDYQANVEVLDQAGYVRCYSTSMTPKQKLDYKPDVCRLDKFSVTFKTQDGTSGSCKVETGPGGKVEFDGTNCKSN
jgi:hypothetical protein